ncbi:MAG: adenylate kinase family protein [Candidatus Odinarchaeia archaeon]
MQGKIILISGTPGTGKTTVARKLSEITGFPYLNLTETVIENKLYAGEDKERETKIVELSKIWDFLKNFLKEACSNIILDSHLGDAAPPENLLKAIILRAHPSILEKRLKQRGWRWSKILENIQAEILDVCLIEALNAYSKSRVYEIDTSKLEPDKTVSIVLRIIEGAEEMYRAGGINWLGVLEEEGKLSQYFP